MVSKALHGLQPRYVLRQQAKDLGVMDFAQDIHFTFGIADVLGETLVQFCAESRPVRRDFVKARVEHFVQQDRVSGKVIGCPGGTADDLGHFAQRLRVLLQQGKIGSSSTDRFQEIESALQGCIGRVGARCRFDQARAKRVKALTVLCR